MSLGTDVHEIQ